MIKTLILFFLFFYLIYQVSRFLIRPFLFFQTSRSKAYSNSAEGRKEGDIKVDFVPPKKKQGRKEGEYIDFEELD